MSGPTADVGPSCRHSKSLSTGRHRDCSSISVLPVMAVAILCVWATHSSVPAPVCESAPRARFSHELLQSPFQAPEMAASAAEPPKFLASA